MFKIAKATVAAAFLLSVSTVANAATTTFTFTENNLENYAGTFGYGWKYGTNSNPLVFSGDTDGASSGDPTPSITVFGFEEKQCYYSSCYPSVLKHEAVEVYPGGLGIDHQISNETYKKDSAEFVVLDLGSANWSPVSLTLSYVDGTSTYKSPSVDDAAVFAYAFGGDLNLSDINALATIENSVKAVIADENELPGSPFDANSENATFDGYRNFLTIDLTSIVGSFRYFAIQAPFRKSHDDFKVYQFQGTLNTTPVPLPPTFLLLATALAGLGVRSWKKRS